MKSVKLTVIALLLVLLPGKFLAQSPKKFCETGEKFEKAGSYAEALDSYNKAIAMDSTYARAFESRASCYEKMNKKEDAARDYSKAVVLNPKDKELFFAAGKLFVSAGDYKEADKMFRKALELDRAYPEVIEAEIAVIHKLKDYENGLNITQLGIDSKRSALNYYNHGVIHDSLNHYPEAEKYYKYAKEADGKFIPALVALAYVETKLGKPDDAMVYCESVLSKEPGNTDVLFARSMVYSFKKDFQNAINDITKVILSNPSTRAFKQRAMFYETMGQHHNAIADYSNVLKSDDQDVDAYLRRAADFEQIQNMKEAVADYNRVLRISKGKANMVAVAEKANAKIYDLNKETGKPEIEFTSAKIDQGNIKVSADKNEFTLKGRIKDASTIKSITASAGTVEFSKDSINPEFTIKLTDLLKLNELNLVVADAYNNSMSAQYKFVRTESDKPIIAIETPFTSFENEMAIDMNGPDLYIQGKIKDASLIESIVIDGINASFNPNVINPDFSAQIKIADKQSITMAVRDIYGNENKQVYNLNRSGALAGVDNPMGNTWVVFIENSKYINFPSLEGPAKDVTAMRAALANYKITKIIPKKDMTKMEMEKFFSIELRDYVKNNNINSLLIWYAGHGKYVSPTGYWVPSDGKVDDEFSYFGINNLKAAMQSYAGKLVHTLVITDACESGATFLMAMRGGDDEKRCDNWELTKAKSSQVFTSAGYELASDNSQFTKTFVSCLNNNVEPCLAIEKIVRKVTAAVSQAGNQAPKFGKIKDLEDEGGTFFFIKK